MRINVLVFFTMALKFYKFRKLDLGLHKKEIVPIDNGVDATAREIDNEIVRKIKEFMFEEAERDRRQKDIEELLKAIAEGKFKIPREEPKTDPIVIPFPYYPEPYIVPDIIPLPITTPYYPYPYLPYVGDPPFNQQPVTWCSSSSGTLVFNDTGTTGGRGGVDQAECITANMKMELCAA
jgi:hypothetical protein